MEWFYSAESFFFLEHCSKFLLSFVFSSYCMRVMMEEVPDVGWLCEACQSEVEVEKKTNEELQKFQVKNGVKGLPTEGNMINHASKANIRSSSENKMHAIYVGGEESEIGSQDNYMVIQKKEAEAGATSCGGKNLHEPSDLSIEADSEKGVLLSCGSSFKFDMKKGKCAQDKVSNSLAPNVLKNKAHPDHGKFSTIILVN
jgi:hypothetical protein